MTSPTTPATPTCALGLSDEALSAWRDDALRADEMGRIGAHILTCAACQATLGAYETLAGVLRQQRVPIPDARLWRELEARIQRSRRPRRTPRDTASPSPARRRPPARSVVSGLGAVAAVLLLVAAFARLLSGVAPHHVTPSVTATSVATATLTPTATPLPTAALTQGSPPAWQAHASPPLFTTLEVGSDTVGVAPSDGRTAYACVGGNTPRKVLVTRDGGATWNQTPTNPAGQYVGSCSLAVDAFDPNIVAVYIDADYMTATPVRFTKVTLDGGATWRALDGLNGYVGQLATVRGATYMVVHPADSTPARLYISTDGLHTWHANAGAMVDPTKPNEQQSVSGVWANPFTGDLLAQTWPYAPRPNLPQASLWLSHDQGANWALLSTQPINTYVVQAAQEGNPWRYCAYVTGAADQPDQVICAATSEPQAVQTRAGPPAQHGSVVALANDGGLLILSSASATNAVNPASSPPREILRLRANPTIISWQDLGPTPAFTLTYAAGPGAGMLWATPAVGIGTDHRFYSAVYQP